jgi:putative ABC transport system ATP-binding protein
MKNNSDSSKKCEIRLKNIKKTYVMGEVKVPVLHGLDLEIYKGEITVILGASGSGKSTLLNIIGGIDKPTEGEVWFENSDIAKLNDRKLTDYRRNNIGFVFQFYNLVPTLTAKENLEVSTEIAKDFIAPAEALKLVDMEEQAEHFPSQMSGGQQQRISIARALAKKPALMLCDEPTGALDFKTGQLVLKTLIDLNKKLNTTIVIITHCAPLAGLAHRVVNLGSGIIDKSTYNEKQLNVEEIVW